jgi:hypothetical protein
MRKSLGYHEEVINAQDTHRYILMSCLDQKHYEDTYSAMVNSLFRPLQLGKGRASAKVDFLV